MSIKQKRKKAVVIEKNQTGAIMIRVGHEKCGLIHKAARHAGMSKSRLCGILALDGASKILAGKISVNTETKLIEK